MVSSRRVSLLAPKIKPPRSTEIATYVGKTVILDCHASGRPPAQISWILPDRTFVREPGTIHTLLSSMALLPNGTLQINSANFSSKGDYKCIASNAAGADTVTYHLHVAALIIWISPRKDVISVSSSRFQISSDGTLVLNKVTLADEGKYTCVARNSAGDDVKDMKIEVESQEPFINGLKGKSATKVLGISYQTALLHCRGGIHMSEDDSLVIHSPVLMNSGIYKCNAKNALGTDFKSTYLQVV
uniref:Ig-like domain-containing protein n=1 Tax=Salarias fasciatus TaxID=181472 RepID=A0A672FH14_SALFA